MMGIISVLAYIDPGTGSALFATAISLVSLLYYFVKSLFGKIISILRNKQEKGNDIFSRKELVIFSEGKQYVSVFREICRLLDESDINCEYWTTDQEDEILNNEHKKLVCRYIGEGNSAYYKLNMMNSKICLSTTPGLEVYQWKKSKAVDEYIHIFHSLTNGLTYRMFGIDFYDTLLTVGEFQETYIRKIEKLRDIKAKNIMVVGCTYLDELMQRKNALNNNDKSLDGKTIILAPTWGEEALLSHYGKDIIKSVLNLDYNLIIRPHPQSLKVESTMIDELIQFTKNNAKVVWDLSDDNFDSLSKADLMISDFSSVMFDFAFIFEKPVLYVDKEIDISIYDAAWLDEPIWIHTIADRIGYPITFGDFERVQKTIEEVIKDNKLVESGRVIRDGVWAYEGESSNKILDYIECRLNTAYNE